MWWKIKTLLTRNNIIKYWGLSIDMCQSTSAIADSVLFIDVLHIIIYSVFSGVKHFTTTEFYEKGAVI